MIPAGKRQQQRPSFSLVLDQKNANFKQIFWARPPLCVFTNKLKSAPMRII